MAALLIGLGAWWRAQRSEAPQVTAEREAMPPEEAALREAARRQPRDAGAHYDLGRYLLAQRRPYEAMWAFQDALEQDPARSAARQGLARALIVAQLPQRSLEALAGRGDDPRQRVPTNDQRPTTNEGEDARSSDVGRSSELVVVGRERSDLENRRVAAAAHLAMGDPVTAVSILLGAGPALDGSGPALLDLANAAEAMGDDAAAEDAYRRYNSLQRAGRGGVGQSAAEGELGLARIAIRGRRWADAVVALTGARRDAPGDVRTLYLYGLLLLARDPSGDALEKPGGALAVFRQLLQRAPGHGPANLQIGLWLLRHRRAADAVSYLQRAADAGAGGPATRARLADALAAAGRAKEAAHARGLYYQEIRQPHRAVAAFQRETALDPDGIEAPLALVAAAMDLNQKEQAEQVARRALERHPDHPRLLDRHTKLLLMNDQAAAAAEACRRWLARHPDAAEPYHILARMEREGLRFAEAARLSQEAIARDPQRAEYYLEAARAHIALGGPANLRRAAELLRQGIDLNPRDAESHLRLGEALEGLGDREGARRHYLRSMDRDRSARYGVFALSQLCPRLGKADRAGFYAAIVRSLQERESTAQSLWRRIFAATNDADAHARLARLLLEAGDLRQARHHLARAVELRPSDRALAQQLRVVERILELREG
jgi:tetratricopeptide (TPR) repeat protein